MTDHNSGIEAALLPCPFCGEKKIFFNAPSPSINFKGSINCPACLATMPREVNDDQELIGCWNTRAPPAASGDLRERIARIKADPGDGTLPPDVGHVLARGFEAMGWERPQSAAQDMLDAILAALPGRDEEAKRTTVRALAAEAERDELYRRRDAADQMDREKTVRIVDLEAKLKEAEKVIAPFAYLFDLNDCAECADDDALEIPIGDLRAARAFLAQSEDASRKRGE